MAAALLAGAAAVGAAAAGLAFWKRKKHNALPAERQRSRKPCPWKSRGRKPPTGRPLVRRRPQRRQSLR